MKNRQQLVNRAIKELGLIPLTTENYASVNELVDGLFDSLNHRDIVYVVTPTTATASIDEELFLPLATCLAYRAAPEMGGLSRAEVSQHEGPPTLGQCSIHRCGDGQHLVRGLKPGTGRYEALLIHVRPSREAALRMCPERIACQRLHRLPQSQPFQPCRERCIRQGFPKDFAPGALLHASTL